jgi:hypothetical protein
VEADLRNGRGSAFVVVLLHAVGVGHALDAVQLHGPHQIEPWRLRGRVVVMVEEGT